MRPRKKTIYRYWKEFFWGKLIQFFKKNTNFSLKIYFWDGEKISDGQKSSPIFEKVWEGLNIYILVEEMKLFRKTETNLSENLEVYRKTCNLAQKLSKIVSFVEKLVLKCSRIRNFPWDS